MYVGEVLRWSIKVEGHENINLKFPNLDIDNDSVKIKQIVLSENINNRIEFEIISWEIGNFTTPSYSIEILDDNGVTEFTMIAPPQEYTISSILSTLDDENFRPLKGPVPVRDVWPIKNLILFFLIVIIVYAIIAVWKKREKKAYNKICLLYTSPSPRDMRRSRMPSSA